MVEITSEEENKVKRTKRTEDSLRDLWDNIRCTNIQIIGVPEAEDKKKGYEKKKRKEGYEKNFEELNISPVWKRKS